MNAPLAPDAARSLMLQMGDSALILSHRLSEWSGVAPTLEDDLALSNVALDLLGQARFWLRAAGLRNHPWQSEDQLAFHRDVSQFRNLLLVEQVRGDFADTIVRQFLFDAWHCFVLRNLAEACNADICDIAGKALREARYHLEYSRNWILCIGNATEESVRRSNRALARCWPYASEMFAIASPNIAPHFTADALEAQWTNLVTLVLAETRLAVPAAVKGPRCGLDGLHGEELVAILSEMRSLTQAEPEAIW